MSVDPAWLSSQFSDLSGIAPLAGGGQKWVFSAQHPTDGDVVLKLIQPGQDTERVRREIAAVVQIGSDRVPTVYARGTIATPVGDAEWIREQRIDGETLRARIARGPLPLPDILRIGRDVVEALVAAENAHIVHRDVKPDNLIIDSAGHTWLIDFGLARHLDLHSLTATAAPFGVGTPGYAPPEQFRNHKQDIDARADLFALGVTLYEAAAGANPFRDRARDPLEVLRRVERMVLPLLPPPLDVAQFIATLTRARRDHRPMSATEALVWINELCLVHGIS